MELKWKTYSIQASSELDLAKKFVDAISENQKFLFYGNNSAVYFVTSNAGTFSSIELWKNALEHSPRFANPGIFPWTLANATSGYIARRFSITGPNYTIINTVLDENYLISNYKKDQLKYKLKNALCVYWELKSDNKLLSVSVQWAIFE